MGRNNRVIMPYHVVQRVHNRKAVFVEEEDTAFYLESLSERKSIYDVKAYAWCLMTNHVHLIFDSLVHMKQFISAPMTTC